MRPAEISPTPLEFAGIIFLCFGWFIITSIASLFIGIGGANFSNSTLLQLVMFELFCGALALMVLRQRGYVLRELIPTPRLAGMATGAVLYASTTLIYMIAQVALGTHQTDQPIERIMEAATPSIGMILLLSVVNGFYEEVFALGYVVRAAGKYGGSFAIGASTLIRLAYHVYQGPLGALFVVIFSIVLGAYYWRTRNLWPAVFAHMLGDTVPFLWH